jgi:hypothetical protein
MKIVRAIELIRNWSILVDHDIPDECIVLLAMLIESETEKERTLINSGSCIYHECDDATRIS